MKAASFLEIEVILDKEETDIKAYQRLVGRLMYLACGTRPDIAFAVGQLSRHNSNSLVGHMKGAKQVLQYLKGTMNLGITYGRDAAGHIETYKAYGLVGYADSNYAGNPKDRKSVLGYCFYLNGSSNLEQSEAKNRFNFGY